MPEAHIPNGVLAQGGPLDGRTLPLFGNPLDPPDELIHQDDSGLQHVYTPRPRYDADDRPIWLYVHIRTEPMPKA